MGDEASYGADSLPQLEALVAAVAERLLDVMPADQFEVAVDGRRAIRILGVGEQQGSTCWVSPVFLWDIPVPVEDRVLLFLHTVASRVQDLLSTRGRPWPATGTEPKVYLDGDAFIAGWVGQTHGELVAALRPILLSEIGSRWL